MIITNYYGTPMVEISPSCSLPLDQVVVVGSIKQQLHSTTTTVALIRHCHCSLLLLVPTGDARPLSPDPEGGRGVAVAVVPPSLSSRPNPPPHRPQSFCHPCSGDCPPSNQGISGSALLQCCAAPLPWRRPPPWRMTRCCRCGAPPPPWPDLSQCHADPLAP